MKDLLNANIMTSLVMLQKQLVKPDNSDDKMQVKPFIGCVDCSAEQGGCGHCGGNCEDTCLDTCTDACTGDCDNGCKETSTNECRISAY